jgi:hypothetical protein
MLMHIDILCSRLIPPHALLCLATSTQAKTMLVRSPDTWPKRALTLVRPKACWAYPIHPGSPLYPTRWTVPSASV